MSSTAIQQIVAKALIDAGMLLQKTNATPKKITQQTQDTDTADTDTDNTDAAFGRKKPRKRAIKKTKKKIKKPNTITFWMEREFIYKPTSKCIKKSCKKFRY